MSDPGNDAVVVTRAGAVTTLALNRPDKLNAFNTAMHQALGAALADAAADAGCRCVVVTGAGRGFSAGQDLADVVPPPGQPQPPLAPFVEAFNTHIRAIRTMEKPVIAAVNGMAAGASANLALCCDIVYAARSASFLQAFAKIGLIPDGGGTWTLPRLVGEARARALCMLAEPIKAEQAEAWGMIWKVVDDGKLMDEVSTVAARLADAPTQSFALQKKAFLASQDNSLNAQLDLERDLQCGAATTPDYIEGVAAFLEKRAAKFTGRKA